MIRSFRSCLWYSVGWAPVDVFLVPLLTSDEPYFKSVYWPRCETYSGVFRFGLRYPRGRHLHYALDWRRSRVWRSYPVLIRLLAPFRFYLTSHLLLCFIGLFSVFISKASSSIAFKVDAVWVGITGPS